MSKTDAPGFTVNIFFSEPIEFTWDQITADINAQSPSCTVTGDMNLPGPQRTDSVVIGALQPQDPANGSLIMFNTMGTPDAGFQSADHTELGYNSARFPGAVEAVRHHQSYLAISVTAADDSLVARFRAARQLTCATAVFAKMPQTMGILVCWANQVVSPADWIAGTDHAIKGKWPLLNWISCRAGWDAHMPGSQNAAGLTIGLKDFAGTELHHAPAPMQPTEVIAMLYTMTHMVLELGHEFNDGDSMGGEDGSVLYRTRFRPQSAGFDHIVRVMIRHDSTLDEMAEFGPRPGIAPPDRSQHVTRGKKGFLRGLLGRH